MTKYLVTGSTGFIGTRMLGFLKTLDCDVRVLARSKVDNYETVICNLGKDEIPKFALESIDVVYHIAGLAHDMQDPENLEYLYNAVNVNATVELARLAVKKGVKRFIFVSSVKAGGLPLYKHCATESDQNEPLGIYGKSKRKAELELLKIGYESNMHVSIVRPSLVYGPGVKGNLQSMLSGVKNGWFPPLPETGNRHSMIHVDDLVRAIFLVSEDERARGEIYIASDGLSHSSRDIYSAMCYVAGKSVPRWTIPKFFFKMVALVSQENKHKVDKLFGDDYYCSEKLELLGFKAQKTLLDMNETSF